MDRYDYRQAVREDLREFWNEEEEYYIDGLTLEERQDPQRLAEMIEKAAWTADSVTGNGSGSYFFNTWRAEEALCHNWDLLEEAAETFGISPVTISDGYQYGAEYWDSTIRCYLLPEIAQEIAQERAEELAEEIEQAAAEEIAQEIAQEAGV